MQTKRWYNVQGEKRLIDDTVLRDFYAIQFDNGGREDVKTVASLAPECENGQDTCETPTNEPEFTMDEFKEHLAKLSLRRAPGPNGIRSELIVHGGDRLHTLLLELFNACWMGKQVIPRAWVDANVVPIYKGRGSRSEPGSYRPIFLLDVIGKLYSSMVVGRLSRAVDGILPETQYGFRTGFSTEQAVLAVRTLVRKSLDQGCPVDLVFVDITKAFDTVPHKALFDLLQRLGTSANIQRSMRQLHSEPRGTIQGSCKSFACKRGVREGSIEGPLLFNLFLQGVLDEVSRHVEGIGVPLIALPYKERWTLRHLEYADDLVLVASSPETAQIALNGLVTVLRRYQMAIAPAKTVWMHVGGSDGTVPETLSIEGASIARQRRVTYLGSVLDADGDPSGAVSANALRAKRQVVRIRPLLRSPAIGAKRKAACIETFVKPSLLYGLATIVLRVNDERKLSAVVNTAKRMALDCWSRRELTVKELDEVLPTSSVAAQLRARRLNLWVSASKCTGVTSRLCHSELEVTRGRRRPAHVRDWMRQLRKDAAEVFGSDEAAEGWITSPSPKWPKANLSAAHAKLLGSREHGVVCLDRDCNSVFATVKEMNRHMRVAHVAPCGESTETDSKPFACPMESCHMRYRTKGWLARHIELCHKTTSGQVEAQTPAFEALGVERGTSVQAPSESVHGCPLCTKTLPTWKGIVNHCYTKHRYSVIKGTYMNESTAGTAAKSSDSPRSGLPGSAPK